MGHRRVFLSDLFEMGTYSRCVCVGVGVGVCTELQGLPGKFLGTVEGNGFIVHVSFEDMLVKHTCESLNRLRQSKDSLIETERSRGNKETVYVFD